MPPKKGPEFQTRMNPATRQEEHKHPGFIQWHPTSQTHAYERVKMTPEQYKEEYPEKGQRQVRDEDEQTWEIANEVIGPVEGREPDSERYHSTEGNEFQADVSVKPKGMGYLVYITGHSDRGGKEFTQERGAKAFIQAIFEQKTFKPTLAENSVARKTFIKSSDILDKLDNLIEKMERRQPKTISEAYGIKLENV